MPYKKLEELPAGVKDNLPKRAQRLYMAAFNSAAEGKDATDEKSAAIAWSAVKAKYQKDDNGDWVKLQESAPRGSYEAERDTLYDALREDAVTLAKMKPTTAAATDLSSFPYIEFTFPDRIVVSCHDDKWSIPYTKTDGVVQFGEPTKVEIEATVVPDTSVQESKTRGQCGGTCRMTSDKPDLTETVTVNFGWDGCPPDVVHGPGDEPVTLLAAGPSKGHDYAYSQNAIRESAGSRLFDATPVFLNHESASSARDRVHRPVEEMAGYITRTWSSADGNRLDGVLHVSNGLPSGKLLESALSDPVVRAHLGLSITAYRGRMGTGTFGGKVMRTVESIRARDSVDVVPDPAAGGAFNRILESAGKPKGAQMPTEQELADQLAKDKFLESTKSENDRLKADLRESRIRSLLDLSKIPEAQRKTAEEKILGDLKSRTDLADDKLQEAVAARIAAEIDYLGLAKPRVNMPGNLGGGDNPQKTLREQLDSRQVS